ncbi:MAG: Rpn family recombination-promoting nuclease/putative transposase [Treponema sp.]|nr:Rpn family recombination-promoting nuclease/putative transposase [Treponema sp.]
MAAVKNPMIDEAYRKLQVMSKDAVNRRLYAARLKAQRDEYSHIQGALREGLEKGQDEFVAYLSSATPKFVLLLVDKICKT